jgi:hypothetical protein
MASMPHLEEIIQRLYDSEINLTITMLWDGGFDFAFASTWNFMRLERQLTICNRLSNTDRGASLRRHGTIAEAHANLQRPFMRPRSTNILNRIMRKPTGVRISNQRTRRTLRSESPARTARTECIASPTRRSSSGAIHTPRRAGAAPRLRGHEGKVAHRRAKVPQRLEGFRRTKLDRCTASSFWVLPSHYVLRHISLHVRYDLFNHV